MELILTHENADFDAVASQLAAHKLMPEATPVLPARQNRNVRRFLALYGDEFPFIQSDDLPRRAVSRVVLVDTQHVQTVRGMSRKTSVQVIDHHALQEPVKPNWQVTVDQVGAATTLLTERLQAQNVALSPIEATLLVLGIYEDTGSLSYGATTPRDAHAAGWLLERGALLDVARNFLRHSLSDDQLELYQTLLEGAETCHIAGETVVVAAAASAKPVEEIATLAHRLRDLLDPSAIFVLVDQGSHIQMVARSSSDAVDVGAVASRWGGGGHGRAAAAILKGKSLEDARTSLLEILPEVVRPGLTVADLMSQGVRTLAPDIKARDADARMRRYGYEGFPVVRDGQLVGLLTRRAVDRALGHGLDGVPVEHLMEAGSVSVKPSDTLAALQQAMMSSGWGQIPVVDDRGKIKGVVTRTDLIKHLGIAARADNRRAEIVTLLEKALPAALLALSREAGRVAASLGLGLYVVGGAVRDLLLGHPIDDIDFVVEGDAVALTRALRDVFGGEMRSHDRFGTGKWLTDADVWKTISSQLNAPISAADRLPAYVDFVTARTEYYAAPTELPQVEGGSVKHDLHRRDFTINTLAIRLDPSAFGQLLDFYGGESDLSARRIRVLHSLSFVDDPTRMLRAARLERRLGFRIEPRTEELIGHALPLLDKVSGDRLRHEIEYVLEEARPEDIAPRLDELGISAAILPEWRWRDEMGASFDALREAVAQPLWPELAGIDLTLPYFAVWSNALDQPALAALCQRLKVRRRTVTVLDRFQAVNKRLPELSQPLRPSQIDRLLAGADDRALLALWATTLNEAARAQLADFALRLRHIRPMANGHTLRQRGLPPGAQMARVLADLRAAWLDGEIATSDQESALLDKLISPYLASLAEETS